MNIYALTEPDGRIRYVGKTKRALRERLSEHLTAARMGLRTHRDCWIRALLKRGELPGIVLVEECRGDGCAEEVFHIALARADGIKLVNGTRGGDGVVDPTAETRERMSAAKRGKPLHPNLIAGSVRVHKGMKHSPEFIEKRSAPMRGRPLSQSHLAAIQKAAKTRRKADTTLLGASGEAEVCALYRAGERTVVIAQRFNVRRDLVSSILRRHGVPIRPHSLLPDQIERMRKSKAGRKQTPQHVAKRMAGMRAARECRAGSHQLVQRPLAGAEEF